ncbi:MAG: tetratricopeptide repeat protein [Kiloniellaceae bacterium]
MSNTAENLSEPVLLVPAGKLRCYVHSNTLRRDTPEEHVRQRVARSLVEEYGYSKRDLHLEFPIKVGSARNSSFTYKGKSVDVKQVAEELGVRYVLEGSVRKAGSRVRISAQLIDAATGNHVWAERYDRELADIFDLQDEMTATIVGAIEPELSAAERERAKRKPPDNLDAWDRYQRGLWHLWRYTRDDYGEAEKLFQSAIALDPGFGPAYAGVAYLLNSRAIFGWTDTPDQTLGRALRAGQHAVSADDRDPFAHYALGRVLTLQGDFEVAIAELEKAIDLNPNLALAHYGLGFALTWSGRAREALPHFHNAIRQSPHDPALWTFEALTGFAHIQLGEYAEAVEWQRKAARHPNSILWPNLNLAVAFVEQEEWDKARAAMDAALELQPDLSLTAVAAMLASLRPDLKDRHLDALRKAGLPE